MCVCQADNTKGIWDEQWWNFPRKHWPLKHSQWLERCKMASWVNGCDDVTSRGCVYLIFMRINGDWHQLTDFLQQLLQYRCTLYLAILKWFGMQVLIHKVKLINNMMNKLFTCCAWVSHDTGKKSMFAICIWANVKLWEACADSTGWWFSRQDDYFHAQDLSDCCKGYDESLQLILETIKEQVKSSFGTHSSHLAAVQVGPSLRSPECEILLRQNDF